MVSEKLSRLEEELIKIGITIAKKNEGALFLIGDHIPHKKLIHQKVNKFNIFKAGAKKLLLSLSMIDGAILINKKGTVYQYGAKVPSNKVYKGFGTRTSAGYSMSFRKDTTAILVSQEEKKIKLFKQGKILFQIDALEKNVEKEVSELNILLQTLGVSSVPTVIGASGLLTVNVPIATGILVFGVPYYLYKRFMEGKRGWDGNRG